MSKNNPIQEFLRNTQWKIRLSWNLFAFNLLYNLREEVFCKTFEKKLNKNMEEGSIPMAIGIFIFILGRSNESHLSHTIWFIFMVLIELCYKDFQANYNNVFSAFVTTVKTIQ